MKHRSWQLLTRGIVAIAAVVVGLTPTPATAQFPSEDPDRAKAAKSDPGGMASEPVQKGRSGSRKGGNDSDGPATCPTCGTVTRIYSQPADPGEAMGRFIVAVRLDTGGFRTVMLSLPPRLVPGDRVRVRFGSVEKIKPVPASARPLP